MGDTIIGSGDAVAIQDSVTLTEREQAVERGDKERQLMNNEDKEQARQLGLKAITEALSKFKPTRDAFAVVVKKYGDPTVHDDDDNRDIKVIAFCEAAMDKSEKILKVADTSTAEGVAAALEAVVGPSNETKLGRGADFIAAAPFSKELKIARDLYNGDNPKVSGIYVPLWNAHLQTRGYLPPPVGGIIVDETDVRPDMSES